MIQPRTIFVGGGTPTLLVAPLWSRLLETMRSQGVLDAVEEFTVEANPETVSTPLMEVLAAGGVNRISIGAQSFNPTLLKTLERWHDPASVAAAVRAVRDSGINDINLDLIFGIPGQTLAMLEADLNAALALQPTHLSCYNLTYEPNTAMTQRLKLGRFEPIDEGLERDMYALVMQKLQVHGYEHYEISNWSVPGKPCRHNLLYWSNRNWIGLGPSAASHVDGHRWRNVPHLGRYLSAHPEPPVENHEHLPPDRAIGEQLMLSLRMRRGIPLSWLARHVPGDDPRHEAISEMMDLGLLEKTRTHLRLTDTGLFVADAVTARLL